MAGTSAGCEVASAGFWSSRLSTHIEDRAWGVPYLMFKTI